MRARGTAAKLGVLPQAAPVWGTILVDKFTSWQREIPMATVAINNEANAGLLVVRYPGSSEMLTGHYWRVPVGQGVSSPETLPGPFARRQHFRFHPPPLLFDVPTLCHRARGPTNDW